MKEEVNSELYHFYKKQYNSGVILFHTGDKYEAYNEDAKIVNKVANLHANLCHPCYADDICSIEGDSDSLLSFTHSCQSHHIELHIISSIAKGGAIVLPKVKQILQDMEDDY